MNVAPAGAVERDLPAGFIAFYLPLHRRFTPAQQALVQARKERLARAHAGDLPHYLPPSEATRSSWRIEVARLVRGSTQSDDRPRRRRRALREDAQLRRTGSNARSRRLDGQHLGPSDARASQHRRRALRRADVRRRKAWRHGRDRAERDRCVEPRARAPSRSSRRHRTRSHERLALRSRAARLQPRLRAVAPSALHLHSEIGVGARGALVEGCLRRADRGEGLETRCDQGNGADRIASDRLRDRRVPV